MDTIRYTSLMYDFATQNPDGTWTIGTVTSEAQGEWGTFRIEAGAIWDTHGSAYAAAGSVAVKTAAGTTITTVNGAPTTIDSLSFGEPYGETTGSLTVPITPFDDASAIGIYAGGNIDIWRVLPASLADTYGTAEVPFWHGIVASLEYADGHGITSALSVQMVGALYGECSVRAHQPLMLDTTLDAGQWIGRALSPSRYERPLPPFERFTFESDTTNIDLRYRGSRGQSVIDYLDEVLALAKDSDFTTWTVSRAYQAIGTAPNQISVPRPRHYYIRLKQGAESPVDVQTSNVWAGGYGVSLSVSTDAMEAPTAIYGEGVHPISDSPLSGSRWRNAKYPMLGGGTVAYPDRIGTASTYPIQSGDADADFTADVITQVQAQLRAGGWPDTRITGTWDADTSTGINALWDSIGSAQDSKIASDGDWGLLFNDANGGGYTDLTSGFFLPLHDANAYYTYTTTGDVIGTASGYDPTLLRVEETIAYGDGVSKSRARKNAKRIVRTTYTPTIGTLTLTADPVDENLNPRSRLDIREGGWVYVENFFPSQSYYIAGITIQPEAEGMPVTLTITDKPTDLLALATKIERNKAAKSDPARSFYNQRTQTVRPFRSVVGWDAESGAGMFKGSRSFAAAGSAWTVHRILGAQYGSIEALRVDTSPDTAYAFAVFGGSVSSAALGSVIPSPLGTVTGDYPSWWQHPDNLTWLESKGFIEAWGSYGEAAGYYPGAESIGTAKSAGTVTGALEDAGSWTFASLEPPWLWVACWPRTSGTVTVSGQMKIQVEE